MLPQAAAPVVASVVAQAGGYYAPPVLPVGGYAAGGLLAEQDPD